MTLKYTTVSGFLKFLGISENILDFNPGETPSYETVASAPYSTTVPYYVDQLGVNEEGFTVLESSSTSNLTPTTHYSFDSDSSAITLTTAGVTALSTNDMLSSYEYNTFGKYLKYNEIVNILERAEDEVDDAVNTVFADQSTTNPDYSKFVDEFHFGKGSSDSDYKVYSPPVIKLQTTTSLGYVTNNSTVTVTSAAGFPNTGTIYIDGNKVTYTSKVGNELIVSTATPSISTASVVRGEVIEVSLDPAGVTPSFTVLTPDTEYNIDYDTGGIQLLDDYYIQNSYGLTRPPSGVSDRLRLSYMSAWHEVGKDAVIPADIVNLTYMVAARQLLHRTIFKSHIGQNDNFDPQNINFSKKDIEEAIRTYRIMFVNKV